ncbi:nucleotidyltransferase family protein [Candidatus Formimonas warabiya]|uniref:Nucleotidyltransferase n=1 Tax=Formimonas warabiya TaxID=1761012 RepID=A0A3G1KT78_FORW1|nr:nucleotidyltransferase family protein [Candidatus Formimonas warabiya]ATW25682.1 nucleotidyltransferase [Candidatus Formimonas warabiya]
MFNVADLVISEQVTIVEALKKLDQTGKKVLFITDENNGLKASLTDGDIRRWILASGDLNACVSRAMHLKPRFIKKGEEHKALKVLRQYGLDSLPVLNEAGCLIDVLFWHELDGKWNRTNVLEGVPIIIMAGGKGTRLFPYTKILPKPLIPIGDTPIIEHIVNRFYNYGAQRFFLTVNCKKNMIKSYFSEIEKDYVVEYVEEETPLGTGGSLSLLKGLIDCPFFVSNCDILVDADYGDIYNHHVKNGNKMTIVTSLKNVVIPYGVIHLNGEGFISSMEEKPELHYLVNTGLYVLEPDILAQVPGDTIFHLTDLISQLTAKGEKVGVYPVSSESFLDMGQFDELEKMKRRLGIE